VGESRPKPQLLFFYTPSSGHCRRVDGFLAQVLQRRQNHRTFDVQRVDVEQDRTLAEHFRIEAVPTLVVVDDNRVMGRLESPRGAREIEKLLTPWLR
jgi:thioredoxin-like negative regulator of GroEL